MRFAVSLLMFVCVASLIGTVLAQNQAPNSYVDQFGPFWFAVFDKFSVWRIYNSWWFLLIMGFLVVSTSICLVRNTPRMLTDARSFREYIRASSLRSFHHRVECVSPVSPSESLERVQQWLGSQGYRFRIRRDGDGTLVAAKKGGANRLGYIFTHGAIVIILVGALLDSELPTRLAVWYGDKQPITENMLISQVPDAGVLPAANPSFRANMLIPEGSQSSSGIVAVDDGVLVQPLPFAIKLKKFSVDYYSTGAPSSFKSLVQITDPATGESFEHTIEVNEPLRYKGVAVYQSSFDDGGSKLELVGYPLSGGAAAPIDIKGTVGKASTIMVGSGAEAQKYEVDLSGLRLINVENMAAGELNPQPRQVLEHVAAVAGSAAGHKNKDLRNVGPSVQYRLIGRDGQAHEYNNYMLPMTLDGQSVFLAGVRDNPGQSYRYLRIPADSDYSVAEFMGLRAALADPAMRAAAARRFAEKNAGGQAQQPLLEKAATGALETFFKEGFNGIIARVPPQDQEKVLGFAVPMIQLSLSELRDMEREKSGRPPVDHLGEAGQKANGWVQTALLALANMPDYPAPVFISLKNFQHVQASVFQVARSPGKNVVYLGCIFLVLGVFSMFYIRDRRIWVWIKPSSGQGSEMLGAMTSQRRTLDFNHEFERFKEAFRRLST